MRLNTIMSKHYKLTFSEFEWEKFKLKTCKIPVFAWNLKRGGTDHVFDFWKMQRIIEDVKSIPYVPFNLAELCYEENITPTVKL